MSTKIWFILVCLTLFAFLLGYLEMINLFLVAVLLITTCIKGQLVSEHFMALNNVSLKWRMIPIVWLIIVVSLIGLAYYLPVNYEL